MSAIPAGFEPLAMSGPFQDHVGPLYTRDDGDLTCMGMIVADRHCNNGGVAHGGMTLALADIAFSYALTRKPVPAFVVTTSIASEIAGVAPKGAWLEARVDIMRAGRRVVFATCDLWSGGKRIAHAAGTFQVIKTFDTVEDARNAIFRARDRR